MIVISMTFEINEGHLKMSGTDGYPVLLTSPCYQWLI